MFLGYIRVSEMESLETQESAIRAMASVKGVHKHDVTIYRDEDVAGSVPLKDRPDGKLLWQDLKKGDVICAAKLDRLFTSLKDAFNTITELKALGVNLVLCDLNVDTATADGEKFFGILTVFVQWESVRIRERVRPGRLKAKQEGRSTGPPAYGMMICAGALLPHPEEQVKIAYIMSLHRRGYLNREILAELQRRKYKNRKGKLFDSTQLDRIIASQRWPDLPRLEAVAMLRHEHSRH